jgi:hypothetical protein
MMIRFVSSLFSDNVRVDEEFWRRGEVLRSIQVSKGN